MPKPPVVLLHGLLGSGATWTPLARALEAEFDVIAPDARGHGSSAPADRYTYDALADDVVELIAARSLARPIVVGHSMGGMTAAVVASRGAASRVILVDPTFLSPDRQREVYASDVAANHRRTLALSKSDLVAELRARHPQRTPEIIELLADARSRTRIEAFEILAPPNPDYREVVGAIDVPILLVIGDSTVVTLEMTTELRVLNPRVAIAQIAGAGHGLPFDHPVRLTEVIRTFLACR